MEVLSLPMHAAAAPAAADMASSSLELSAACLAPVAACLAPVAAVASPAPVEGSTSCDGSLASCSTELSSLAVAAQQQQQQQAQSSDSIPPEQRTHHLLKHCLSQGQRVAALQHFNTGDAREAAKEIARMGQRELQAKFKEVYGSATKSNNNSWLRRKLYEAVGVAPLKANTKGKARKAASSASRKSSAPKDSKSRSPKVALVKAKRTSAAAAAAAMAAELSASPMYGGMSILDLAQHSGLLSGDTSDSEDGSGSHDTFPSSLHHSAPDTPRSGLAHLAFPGTVFSGQPLGSQQQPPAGFVPVPVSEPQSPCGLHWADGGFAAAAAATAPAPFLTSASASLPPLDPAAGALGAALAFRSMDLEQPLEQEGQLGGWDASGPGEPIAAAPWYFGASMDLACLGQPMDCSSCDATVCGDDDDDVPLLTLDLGAIDVSI